MLDVINQKFNKLPYKTRKSLLSLCYRRKGLMAGAAVFHNPDTFIVKLNNKVLGWAIVAKSLTYLAQPYQLNKSGKYEIMLYVRLSYRRRGIGSRLFKEATRKYPELLTHPHDGVSEDFFKKVTK